MLINNYSTSQWNINFDDFDKKNYDNIRKNINSNFPNFGLYHELSNCHKVNESTDIIVGDSIDDLSDIILDLLEIKWRIKNNSLNDGLWFFKLIFSSHTQQHVMSLLNYIKSLAE